MPLTHSRVFRVRYYECDAYGHLNNTNYLRYMQETAFEASDAAGYGIDRYADIGCHWLIHGTEIEYLRPLRYGDSVEIKTWVSDFRRLSSRRSYEFRLTQSGELVARAHTDWVFIDSLTAKPVAIPLQLMLAFFPEGLPDRFPPRQAYPVAPAPPSRVFEMRRRVAWQDIDAAQHVNNAAYLTYVEDCGMQAIAEFGWPVTRMTREGFAILLRRHQIQYRKPAFFDEELVLATWASQVKRSTATRHYTIRRASDGELLVRVNTLGVWIDLAAGRPIRIPERFIADFSDNIVP